MLKKRVFLKHSALAYQFSLDKVFFFFFKVKIETEEGKNVGVGGSTSFTRLLVRHKALSSYELSIQGT